MIYLTIFILLLLFIICSQLEKSILHPAVITNGVWCALLLVYALWGTNLNPLSHNFLFAVLLWVVPFSLSSLLVKKPLLSATSMDSTTNPNVTKLLIPITFICVIVSIGALLYRGYMYDSFGNIFNGIRQASVEAFKGQEMLYDFPWYFVLAINISNAVALPLCIVLLFIEKKHSWQIFLLSFMVVAFYICRSNKLAIVQLGCAIICMLIKNKIVTRKNFLITFASFVGLIIFVHILRRVSDISGRFVFSDFIDLYLLAPMPAMDYMMHSPSLIESFNGEFSFRLFTRFFQLFNPSMVGNSDPFCLDRWVSVPVWVNVYTILFPFYEDFGYIGIVLFGAIYGLFFGKAYRGMQINNAFNTIVYAMMLYILAFQWFFDFGMMFFGANLIIILSAIILCYKQKVSNESTC